MYYEVPVMHVINNALARDGIILCRACDHVHDRNGVQQLIAVLFGEGMQVSVQRSRPPPEVPAAAPSCDCQASCAIMPGVPGESSSTGATVSVVYVYL